MSAGNPYAADLMRTVFGYSKITRHIATEARDRLVSEWTLLGASLARAALATPYNWRLPAIVQDDASLNAIYVNAGASGSGKGANKAEIFTWPDTSVFELGDGEQRLADIFVPITVASGEGIAALFTENRSVPGIDGKGKITVPVRIRQAAWIDFDEVDQLAAIGSRQGATLTAELRKGWSSAAVGTYTKVKVNQVTVPAHSYRLVTTVAAQPLRCAPLLAEEAGGTLQRMLWLSADTPDLEDPGEDPDSKPLGVVLPDFGRGIASPGDNGPVHYFDVAPEVRAEIRADRIAGRWKGTEDAHRNLVKLKAAAACAVLHGSTQITAETWTWAESLMTHSTRVRASVRAELAKAEQEASNQRAISRTIASVASDSLRETMPETLADRITKRLREPENVGKAFTANSLRKAFIRATQASLAPRVVEVLLERGVITEAGTSQRGTPVYRTGDIGDGDGASS
ncbi:hypothetical protein QSJ19_14380 [Gordonia sp. ABSL11-1]|uniref:hypothetical protein n=1 Tax=Gordonia sp. ABSL11-1 TaxID=3053924 RepID=UPI002573405D|nr:hypothetical protein [Gordonia sp. ABSL11-1]MDL9946756.1 hypothetical protein [Gordonia sp. ABSL11-1]